MHRLKDAEVRIDIGFIGKDPTRCPEDPLVRVKINRIALIVCARREGACSLDIELVLAPDETIILFYFSKCFVRHSPAAYVNCMRSVCGGATDLQWTRVRWQIIL